jgi:hypothetical protein
MGSPVEVMPGLEAINERLDSTLVQLNRLIHHYADVPLPDDVEGTDPGRDVSLALHKLLPSMPSPSLVSINRIRCVGSIWERFHPVCETIVFYSEVQH